MESFDAVVDPRQQSSSSSVLARAATWLIPPMPQRSASPRGYASSVTSSSDDEEDRLSTSPLPATPRAQAKNDATYSPQFGSGKLPTSEEQRQRRRQRRFEAADGPIDGFLPGLVTLRVATPGPLGVTLRPERDRGVVTIFSFDPVAPPKKIQQFAAAVGDGNSSSNSNGQGVAAVPAAGSNGGEEQAPQDCKDEVLSERSLDNAVAAAAVISGERESGLVGSFAAAAGVPAEDAQAVLEGGLALPPAEQQQQQPLQQEPLQPLQQLPQQLLWQLQQHPQQQQQQPQQQQQLQQQQQQQQQQADYLQNNQQDQQQRHQSTAVIASLAPGPVESSGLVGLGDALVAINSTVLLGMPFGAVISTITEAGRAAAAAAAAGGASVERVLLFRRADPAYNFEQQRRTKKRSQLPPGVAEFAGNGSFNGGGFSAGSSSNGNLLTEAEKRKRLVELFSSAEAVRIDGERLRAIAASGLPEGGGIRPLVWRLLLNCLPLQRDCWNDHAARQRALYRRFLAEFMPSAVCHPADTNHSHCSSSSNNNSSNGSSSNNNNGSSRSDSNENGSSGGSSSHNNKDNSSNTNGSSSHNNKGSSSNNKNGSSGGSSGGANGSNPSGSADSACSAQSGVQVARVGESDPCNTSVAAPQALASSAGDNNSSAQLITEKAEVAAANAQVVEAAFLYGDSGGAAVLATIASETVYKPAAVTERACLSSGVVAFPEDGSRGGGVNHGSADLNGVCASGGAAASNVQVGSVVVNKVAADNASCSSSAEEAVQSGSGGGGGGGSGVERTAPCTPAGLEQKQTLPLQADGGEAPLGGATNGGGSSSGGGGSSCNNCSSNSNGSGGGSGSSNGGAAAVDRITPVTRGSLLCCEIEGGGDSSKLNDENGAQLANNGSGSGSGSGSSSDSHESIMASAEQLRPKLLSSNGSELLFLSLPSLADQELLSEIRKDVERTMPEAPLFADDERGGKERRAALERILFVYAKLNTAVRYVQGMNEIVGTLFFVFATDPVKEWSQHAEEDTFFAFCSVMTDVRDLFVQSLDRSAFGLQGRLRALCDMLERHDPELLAHLQGLGVEPSFYALRWFTTLLSREMELPDTVRLWDALFADPPSERTMLTVYLCVSMLLEQRAPLLESDFGGAIKLLQSYPPTDVATLLERCFALRYYDACMPSPQPPQLPQQIHNPEGQTSASSAEAAAAAANYYYSYPTSQLFGQTALQAAGGVRRWATGLAAAALAAAAVVRLDSAEGDWVAAPADDDGSPRPNHSPKPDNPSQGYEAPGNYSTSNGYESVSTSTSTGSAAAAAAAAASSVSAGVMRLWRGNDSGGGGGLAVAGSGGGGGGGGVVYMEVDRGALSVPNK